MEIIALHRRGWSISAIARHTGRDRKTVRAWLRGERRREARRQPSPLEPYQAYLAQRLADDRSLSSRMRRSLLEFSERPPLWLAC